MREALHGLIRGVSTHYEHEGEPIPERVGKCIDDMKAQVSRVRGAREKCQTFSLHFWELGNEMGNAAWQDGFEAGPRDAKPHDDEIRVDLSLKRLMTIQWLAHCGFETMVVWNKDGPLTFADKADAEDAEQAITKLSRTKSRAASSCSRFPTDDTCS
jgi:hypothetical protein